MRRARVAAIGAALVLLVSAAACGGGSNKPDDGSYGGKEKSGSFQMRECKNQGTSRHEGGIQTVC